MREFLYILFFILISKQQAFELNSQQKDNDAFSIKTNPLPGVLVANDANFLDVVNEFDYALVNFYTPFSCPYCRILEPEFAKAADIIAGSHPNARLMKIDVRDYPQLR